MSLPPLLQRKLDSAGIADLRCLAARIGCQHQTLRAIRCGAVSLSPRIEARLAVVLRVPAENVAQLFCMRPR